MNIIKSNILSTCFIAFATLSSLNAGIVPVGPLQRISPIPVSNPDPIIANLEPVLDELFQFPYYPGGAPDFLSQIVFSYNTYTSGVALAINPTNDKYIATFFGQNRFRDRTGTYFRFTGSITNALSTDGGYSWDYVPPFEQIIPLGGTTSQVVSIGYQMYYGKSGILYAISHFDDLHPNPPNANPIGGEIFSRSFDNGLTWDAPKRVFTSKSLLFVVDEGPVFAESSFLSSPQNEKLLHFGFADIVTPSLLWGSVYYVRSKNGGDTFTDPTQVYAMPNDPVWLAEDYDAAYSGDLVNYNLYGGQVITGGKEFPFTVVDENVLLMTVIRLYPKVGSTTYTQSPADTNVDRAVLRSENNGKTWDPIAYAAPQTVFTFSHDPAGEQVTDVVIFDGSFNTPTVYSQFTGRVYMAYMAGNPNADPDPEVQQFFPYIALNVSRDKGKTWTDPIQINQTPTNISYGRQQAIQPNMTITKDGYVVVAYYDFRNWLGSSGEDRFTTPLNVDAWLDIYKETADPNGGSTGVGLDFVEEIRLTPTSFNGRLTLITDSSNSIPGSNYNTASGTSIGLAINDNNQLMVTFSMDNPFTLPEASTIETGYEGIRLDPNNRINIFLQRYKFPNASNL